MRSPKPTIRVLAAAAALLAGAGALADHPPLGPVDPDAQEQLCVYELNRARHDPAAYGAAIGVDLSSVAAQPPLAVNRNLTGSARFHATEMRDHDYFSHTSQVTGKGPNQMAVEHGYDLFGNGLGYAWGTANLIESNAYGLNRIPTYPSALALLIVDEGVASLGHRIHLLAMHPQFAAHREIGCGRAVAGVERLYSIHTAYRNAADTFLTGVVYADLNGNLRYDAGEGLGGVTVDNGAGGTATSMPSGGWSIPTPDGAYTVTCSGGTFAGTARALATVNGNNVEVDFASGLDLGEVTFAFRYDGLPLPPLLGVLVQPDDGQAPLAVTCSASSDASGTTFDWDLGDGATATGPSPNHSYGAPGLFPVLLEGFAANGTGRALALVTAGGPDGGGNGTLPPASAALAASKGTLKANFKIAGKDQALLTGTLELPANFLPLGTAVEVCVAGAKRTFTLDAKGKGADGLGSTVLLKYRWPKDGSGAPAGAVAKLTAKLKGDLSGALAAAGLRNRTETNTLSALPFAVLLHQQVYRGSADFASKATRGAKGTAKLIP